MCQRSTQHGNISWSTHVQMQHIGIFASLWVRLFKEFDSLRQSFLLFFQLIFAWIEETLQPRCNLSCIRDTMFLAVVSFIARYGNAWTVVIVKLMYNVWNLGHDENICNDTFLHFLWWRPPMAWNWDFGLRSLSHNSQNLRQPICFVSFVSTETNRAGYARVWLVFTHCSKLPVNTSSA